MADPDQSPSTAHHIDAGGELTFDLGGGVTCTKLSVGPMDNNAYLLAPVDGPLVLIDAANDAHRLMAAIGERTVAAIVTTHRHHDHIKALAEVARDTGARCFSGAPDAQAISEATGVEQRALWTGDRVAVGEGHLEVVGLVGHTPGSIALVWRPEGSAGSAFTGDSLFPGGVGKTGSPEDFTSLLNDVSSLLFEALPDETLVHPGHGDATTLGAERPQLAEWRARDW